MAAIAERIGARAAAAAEQHGAGLLEAQLMGDASRAQVGAIAEPAMAGASAAAQLMQTGRQLQRNRTGGDALVWARC